MAQNLIKNPRPLNVIAREIRADWSQQGKGVTPYAEAYLGPMASLDKITDDYYCDSAVSVVAYFLGNANSWKGEVAKRIKIELKAMIGTKPSKADAAILAEAGLQLN